MADLSNSSFIPKRGPTKRKPGAASRHIYIFTLVSYILMFAALLASGGVYFYTNYVQKQLDSEIITFNSEISSFSKSEMQEVMEFDHRLAQAQARLDKSVSMESVFEALEVATIDTAQIEDLELTREGDNKFLLTASFRTDSFDSTIFQRGVYERNTEVSSVVFSDVQTTIHDDTDEEQENVSSTGQKFVSFKAELEVPVSAVPFEVTKVEFSQPIIITEPVDDSTLESTIEAETGTGFNNEENI